MDKYSNSRRRFSLIHRVHSLTKAIVIRLIQRETGSRNYYDRFREIGRLSGAITL